MVDERNQELNLNDIEINRILADWSKNEERVNEARLADALSGLEKKLRADQAKERQYILDLAAKHADAEVWARMPQLASRQHTPKGHKHPQGATGGTDCMFDILVSDCWDGDEGKEFTSLTGCPFWVFSNVSDAVAYANTERQGSTDNTVFYICGGEYTISSEVTLQTPLGGGYFLYGAGAYATKIVAGGATMTVLSDDAFGQAERNHVYLQGIGFDDGDFGTVTLFKRSGGSRVTIQNCSFYAQQSTSVGIDAGAGISGILVNQSRFMGTGTGIKKRVTTNAPYAVINGCFFESALAKGIDLSAAAGSDFWTVTGCFIEASVGIDIRVGKRITITGNNFAAQSRGIRFTGSPSASSIAITGNSFEVGASDVGIDFDALTATGCEGVSIVGNTFRGESGAIGIRGDANLQSSIASNNTFHTFDSGDEIVAWTGTGVESFHNISMTSTGVRQTLADTGSPYGHSSTATAAPSDADYLVGTANSGLSAEIVVGTTPGGELGGTWASPTVDATHSGSAHHTRGHAMLDSTDHTDSVTSTMNTGDLIIGTASGWDDLPIGASGFVLTSDGTTASWAAASAALILQEDNADVNTSTLTLDFTEPDATLLSSGGTEVDVNMALYALLGGRAGGQTLKGGTAASERLDLQSTDHATRASIRAIDDFLASAYLTVRQDGGTTLGTNAMMHIFPDGTRSRLIYAANGSGSWPSVASGVNLFELSTVVNAGTAGSVTVRGLYFNPSLSTASISNLYGVLVEMALGGAVTVNSDISAYRHGTQVGGIAPLSAKRVTSFDAQQFPVATTTGGIGFYRGVNVDLASATRSASLSILDQAGVRIADHPADQRASERSFGLQIDLFDGSSNGVQWPIYYGDVTQENPTVLHNTDGQDTGAWTGSGVTGAWTDNTTEAGTAGGTAFTLLADTSDATYIGTTSPTTFRRILLVLSTAASNNTDLTLVWEYWNGSAWTTLTVQDDSANFNRRGSSISFTPPTDWATLSQNALTRYWVRVRTSTAVDGNVPTCYFVMVDTDSHVPQFGVDKNGQPWIGGTPTAQAVAAGSAYHTSTTETVVHTAVSIPANVLEAGSLLRVTAQGVFSTTGTPTLQMRVRWGGVAGTVLGDSTAITTPSGVTNRGWKVESLIRVVSIGATGTMECQGWFQWATTAADIAAADMENTAVITVDTTLDKDLVLTADWGTSDAANTLTCRQYMVERLA